MATTTEATVKDMEAQLKALQGRVQEMEDDRAIRELLAWCGFNADLRRSTAFAELFTEDGAVDLAPDRRLQGRQQAKGMIDGLQALIFHVSGNNLVTHIEGNEAIAESYSLVLGQEESNIVIRSAASNKWLLRKEGGKWLIKERRNRRFGSEGWQEVLTAKA